MFTQNIINNYLQIPGIDGMLLAIPEILFLFYFDINDIRYFFI